MSHAKRCADKGVANEGWDPKNRQPRSDRLPLHLPFCGAVGATRQGIFPVATLWYNGVLKEKET